jgi:dTDP-4-amino-4,6-dideoxygalactose transaminase
MHPYQAQLILRMLRRMDRIRAHVGRLASLYSDAFRNGSVMALLPSERDDAGLLRYPIAFPGETRAEVLRRALRRGIYLETEFEQLLPDPSEHGQVPNSAWAGRNVILLPLYSSLTLERAARLAREVNEIADEMRAPSSKRHGVLTASRG